MKKQRIRIRIDRNPDGTETLFVNGHPEVSNETPQIVRAIATAITHGGGTVPYYETDEIADNILKKYRGV